MEQGKPFIATDSPLVDFDAICQKVRAAVEPARAHAVSLHDENGEILWLSESSMGPDEHNAVREALDAFAKPNGPPALAFDLGDARSAVLLRAINARRTMVGAVMVILDTRGIKQDERGVIKIMTPKLQRALTDFAGMRPDTEPLTTPPTLSMPEPLKAPATAPATETASAPLRGAQRMPAKPSTVPLAPPPVPARLPATPKAGGVPGGVPMELSLADSVRIPRPAKATATTKPPARATAAPRPTPAPTVAPPPASVKAAPPGAPPDVVGMSEKRPVQTVSPEIDRLHAALRKSPIALHVQRLVPLTKGSQLKRYEVLLRSKAEDAPNSAPQAMLKAAVENGLGSMIDRRVVSELIGWLVHHPDVWQSSAVMFSVNLTATALHDEHFIKFVELCLAKSSLPKAMIAFEVDVPTAVKLGDKMHDLAASLHRLNCPIVLDDFGLRTECFDLLRLPGVRYVKLAAEITSKMRTDKISQAAITAVVQMARVLGMHTVGKRTETAAEQEWLTALGVDFVQSNALSPSMAIESLSKAGKPKG